MKTTIDEKFFEIWKGKKVAMHCKTEEEANEFCKIMYENGLRWNSGSSYLENSCWKDEREDTVYLFNDGVYDWITMLSKYYIILEFEDYIGEKFEEEKGDDELEKVYYHEMICTMLNKMYEEKNSDYGNNFAKVRAEFPNSILIRLSDKLERLKTLYKQDAKVKDETIEDTLMDLANYAIMELVERRMENDC